MYKIPTLFERKFNEKGNKIIGITNKVDRRFQWVLDGEGIATIKFDGVACAVIDGRFYKRYDAQKTKTPPPESIYCGNPYNIKKGNNLYWAPVREDNSSDKWLIEAFKEYKTTHPFIKDCSYEAIGAHFNGNPYKLDFDTLICHGSSEVEVDRSYLGIKKFLQDNNVEGLVFWKDGKPQCKVKRTDFGFAWGRKKERKIVETITRLHL